MERDSICSHRAKALSIPASMCVREEEEEVLEEKIKSVEGDSKKGNRNEKNRRKIKNVSVIVKKSAEGEGIESNTKE